MQQKRNIRLLISLCVLLLVTTIAVFLVNRETEEVDKSVFQVPDLATIDQVVLQRDTTKTRLAFEGARWRVNGQLADRSMIEVLFATLQQAQPKRKLPEKLADSIKTVLQQEGVRVTLFEGEEVQLEFYAGGNPAKTQAYFATPDDRDVYVMNIPGYRVYTSGIFELEEPGWKDKHIFNFNWQNFKGLSVSFTASPADNFEVTMGKTGAQIIGIPQADTTKLNDFLDAVSLLTADQYLTSAQATEYDSALFTTRGVQISISDISGKTYALKLYPEPGKPRVFGMVQGTYPAVFESRKILPLMKSKGWFTKN